MLPAQRSILGAAMLLLGATGCPHETAPNVTPDEPDVVVCTLSPPSCNQEPCTPEEIGRALFSRKVCSSCHHVVEGASSTTAPNLFGIAGSERPLTTGTVLADEAYLRRSIREPRVDVVRGYSPIMPQIRLSEAELDALIAYLQSLH